MQGRLGVRPSPHLALPILPTSIGASATCNVPLPSMYARAILLPPTIHYAHQATIDFTVPTSSEIENYSRRECREALDKIGWSKNGLLDELKKKTFTILQAQTHSKKYGSYTADRR
jgi:hypothetical protein